ncbi:YciI family protein [Sinorhizobium medicae]|uniref:YciI family protein n=1 Tax=Sinorhizobium medicae TaxID=110321 RepID=UPI002AF6B9CD|nr:YciI family protein [Sinorhizobium medicae]WQO70870.1 YciI family protein [Sinorhizobium medicae]
MFYAILAYHEEEIVKSWTREADAELMDELLQVNDRLVRAKRLGPAARLGSTKRAVTLRGEGAGMVIDGPFAETKEQLLGLYVVDCPSIEAAVETARELRRVNPTAVYEIRPISLYLPGATLSAPADNPA